MYGFTYQQIQIRDDSQATLSLHKLVTQTSENEPIRDYSKPQEGLRAALLDHLQEIETELETSSENLSAQAALHIHSSELILTLGHSRSVENFLKSAAKERKFEVVVAECAPACRVCFQSTGEIGKKWYLILDFIIGSHISCVVSKIKD